MAMETKGYATDNRLAVAKAVPPTFIIKYEPTNQPSGPDGCEERVIGTEADAIETIQRLIEEGRTTPGRVQLYGNLNPIIQTSVSFPPKASGR